MSLTSVQRRPVESDQRLRQLERAAMTGDPTAMKQLAVSLKQMGQDEESRNWHQQLVKAKLGEIRRKIKGLANPKLNMRTALNPVQLGDRFYYLKMAYRPDMWDQVWEISGILTEKAYMLRLVDDESPEAQSSITHVEVTDLVPLELYKLENL